MPDEHPLDETIRQGDIYRQYAVTLLAVNTFIFDTVKASKKFTMNEAQKQLSILGGIANNYLYNRGIGIKQDENSITPDEKEINDLLSKHKSFVNAKNDDNTNYELLKTTANEIILEYDRLFLKHGVCK